MTLSSYPFDGQTTTESQYSELFSQLQDSGVVGDPGSTDLLVSADGTGMNVKLQSGFAVVRGHAFANTGVETLTVQPAAGVARVDRAILRLDPSENTITPLVLEGTPGSATPPTLTRTLYGVYEVSLGIINVSAGAVSLVGQNVTPDREFTGTRIRAWTTATRPAEPRAYQLGYNTAASRWEFWNGDAWVDLAPSINWGGVDDKPATFPPAAHGHSGGDITSGTVPFARLPVGVSSTSVARGDHVHSAAQIAGLPPWTPGITPNTIMSRDASGYVAGVTPASDNHLATKGYVDARAESAGTSGYEVGTIVRRDGGGRIVINSPLNPSHAANKGYVDSVAGNSGQADGPTSAAYGRGATGSGYYAVWMNSSLQFMRNTSSRRFKENVRDHEVDPSKVLDLQPRIYDRIDGDPDEYGLIAEEVHELVPELVTWFKGEDDDEPRIDGVRYDLLSVALLDVVRAQRDQLADLIARVETLEGAA